ncbi:MAG: motility protein MotB, partial [Curvibacter sp.]
QLKWLLGSTTKRDLKGLSDYFSSPLKVAMAGGSGAGASPSVLPGGGADLTQVTGQNHQGESADPMRRKRNLELARAEAARQDARRLAALSARISAAISNNPRLRQYSNQIRLETTPDGLQIQIVDDQGRPMFTSGSAIVQPYMREILREIGAALNGVENRISLDGHTDQAPFAGGLQGDKLLRVTGLASSTLLDPANPTAPVNRRISILVLTREAEERLLGINRDAVLSEPEAGAPAAPEPAAATAPAAPTQ